MFFASIVCFKNVSSSLFLPYTNILRRTLKQDILGRKTEIFSEYFLLPFSSRFVIRPTAAIQTKMTDTVAEAKTIASTEETDVKGDVVTTVTKTKTVRRRTCAGEIHLLPSRSMRINQSPPRPPWTKQISKHRRSSREEVLSLFRLDLTVRISSPHCLKPHRLSPVLNWRRRSSDRSNTISAMSIWFEISSSRTK